MKSTIFIILLYTCCIGQNVNIPDSNFKAYLVGNSMINTNSDSEIQVSEAEVFEGEIKCIGKGIADLTGIESFKNIIKLSCSNNDIVSLDLSENKKLESIVCNNNKLTSINVSENVKLQFIQAGFNRLKVIDVSNNILLKYLNLQFNQLESINLTENLNLEQLSVGSNYNISTLDVTQNTLLNSLNCGSNNLSSIDLSNNTKLNHLSVYSNNLSNLDVTNNGKLYRLEAMGNDLSSLNLANNIWLNTLRCEGNKLSSIILPDEDSKLRWLDLSGNKLRELNVSRYTNLGDLNISNLDSQLDGDNKIKILDVSNNKNMDRLSCYNAGVEKLNIANGENGSLELLRASKNDNLNCIQIDEGFVPPTDNSWKKESSTTYGYGDDCSPLSINEDILDKDIAFYPNPVTSTLNIETKQTLNQVSVFNTLGAKVLETKASKLNVSQLQKGLYLVKIATDTGNEVTKRFIKQ